MLITALKVFDLAANSVSSSHLVFFIIDMLAVQLTDLFL
jgi:hypothetical protein